MTARTSARNRDYRASLQAPAAPLALHAALPGPEQIHPNCRELVVIWRSGEVIVWLRNDRGLRYASGRAPRLDAAISRAQRDAGERIPARHEEVA